MRKLWYISAAVVATVCALIAKAGPELTIIPVTTGTNGVGCVTNESVRGYIDSVILELPAGGTRTGFVSVAIAPTIGASFVIASNTISATTLVRPRYYETTTLGGVVDAARTNAASWRYLAWGDLVVVSVTNADPTNVTWRVGIKTDFPKP